jgi:hypothetical protein
VQLTSQTVNRHGSTSRTHLPHARRIPRGSGTKSDPISRLKRQADANQQHIRGMKQRVKRKADRKALEEARQRLVQVLRVIAERPEEVTTGTHDTIVSAMSEAQEIYIKAPKKNARRRTARNGPRPAEAKGVRAKNWVKERYTGDEGDRAALEVEDVTPRSVDCVALAFQVTLDASAPAEAK